MLYTNTKTGAVIDVNSKIGGNWSPVSEPAANTPKAKSEGASKTEEPKQEKKTKAKTAKK